MYSDVIKGCVMGALLGDACGACLEYLGRQPTIEEVQDALDMNGGGYFELAPGQYTDDGEMTAALLNSIRVCKGSYQLAEVAKAYRSWMLSLPFDISNANLSALAGGRIADPDLSAQIMLRARKNNHALKVNCCLMRATPLAIATARLSDQETLEVVAQDVNLTHPTPVCIATTTAYVLAIRHLIHHVFDNEGAIKQVSLYLQDRNPEVQGWFYDALKGRIPLPFPMEGCVRYGFTYAMYHLQQETDYLVALQQILLMGGDTDTNACIVGGMLGAYHGRNRLPITLMRQLVRCNTRRGNQYRPPAYTIKRVMDNLNHLVMQ